MEKNLTVEQALQMQFAKVGQLSWKLDMLANRNADLEKMNSDLLKQIEELKNNTE